MSFLDSGRLNNISWLPNLDSARYNYISTSILDSARFNKIGPLTSQELDSARFNNIFGVTQFIQETWVNPDPTTWSNFAGITVTEGNAGGELKQIMPEVIPTIKYNGIDWSDYLTELSIHQVLGGKTQFSAKFRETEVIWGTARSLKFPSALNPLTDTTIKSHKFDKTRIFKISLSVGKNGDNQIWNSPVMVPEAPRFDGYELEWSGQDLTAILEKEDQSAVDITPYSNNTYTAQKLIREICQGYQINTSFDFPDYQIRQLRRQGGKPIDWIDACCRPYCAQRRWEGETLKFFVPQNPKDLPPKYKLDANVCLTYAGLRIQQNDDWKNVFNIGRLADQDGYYGEQICEPSTRCPGRTVNITFDEPLNNLKLLIETKGYCAITDFVYFDEADNPIPPYPALDTYIGSTKAKRVEATCIPDMGFGGTNTILPGAIGNYANTRALMINMVGYQILVKGGNLNSFSTNFFYTLNDPASVAAFGERIEFSNIEDPILPNAAVAQAYIKAILAENIRKIYTAEVTFPKNFVNPLIQPGDCVSMDDYLTQQSAMKWLVEEIDIHWDGRAWVQKLKLTRGLPS